MIVKSILEAKQPLISILIGKIAYFTGIRGGHQESYISILDPPIYILMLGTHISFIDTLLGVICIGFSIEIVLF